MKNKWSQIARFFFDDISSDLPDLLIRPLDIGITEMPFETSTPHRHDYFQIIWYIKGSGRCQVDFKEFPIVDNAIHLIHPDQIHLFEDTPEISGYIIVFKEVFHILTEEIRDLFFSGNLFLNHLNYMPINVPPKFRPKLQSIMDSLLVEYNHPSKYQNELLKSFLKILLIYIMMMANANESGKKAYNTRSVCIIRDFMTLVDQEYKQIHSVSDYAKKLALTANHLNDVVKSNTGKTAGNLIRDKIILEAKRIAYFTNRSIKEIAFELGFTDENYFSRFFRKYTSQSFTSFRQEIHKKYRTDDK